MKLRKRMTSIILAAVLGITAVPGSAFALDQTVKSDTITQVQSSTLRAAYLRQDVTVIMDGKVLAFYDEQGAAVYPVTYNGSNYLPVRAISGLMGENIEWNGLAKTVYIGRTLSQPVKTMLKPETSPFVTALEEVTGKKGEPVLQLASGAMSSVTVREQRNIYVMYDFEPLDFKNESGEIIYPVNYLGSNYLPIRACAGLMGEDITWDGSTKTIIIGSIEEQEKTDRKEVSEETTALIEFYEEAADVYNSATSKILTIAKWTPQEAPVMAAGISADYADACDNTRKAKALLNNDNYTDDEAEAAQKLYDFAEVTEYYILVMENIAYMAASDQDYSMLAETFLNFAIEADSAMDKATEAIKCLQKD